MIPLAICAVVRNEAANLAEWLAFHRLVGVGRFVLYDDRSTDSTRGVALASSRADVTVYPYRDGWHAPEFYGLPDGPGRYWFESPQCCAFHHYQRFHAAEAVWTAYIDVDEFLFHTETDSLLEVLAGYFEYPAVVGNWLVFGSSGHATRPAGLTIENYTRRAATGFPEPWGRHIKSIVRNACPCLWGPHGSHAPVFEGGLWAVDQHRRPNPWSMTPCPTDRGLRVNHYYHRSHAEAAARLARRDNNAPPGVPNAERIAAHDRNEVEDREILRFLPALKEALCG